GVLLVEIADWERARLRAASARDADVLLDVARHRPRLDLERVDRADVQAFGDGALQAWLLMERAAAWVRLLDLGIDLGGRIVEDTNAGDRREALFAVDSRADHLAGQAADTQRRIREDNALCDRGRFGPRLAAPGDRDAANSVQGDKGTDRDSPFNEASARGIWLVQAPAPLQI